ncbi:alginate lyase-domain-containing protein [Mycena capillaripes]|nr:alginate lyase-domain-containing protein [Mycena capillaripes]
MTKHRFSTCSSLPYLVCVLISLVTGVQSAILTPNTVVLDGARLLDAKMRMATDASLRAALAALTTQADSWLTQGPWSVTNKKITPPGGDIHDYASQAPYFWPSNTSDGCPYVERDGVHNPQVDLYTDHADRGSMFQSSYILALAWYYTGKTQYATKAGDVLRTWFITPATRMNPNLDHAQIIPCANTGRSIGIIDFSQQYTDVVDAAAILASGAPGWTTADINGFSQWNVQFLNWLETSAFGKAETAATNNHGTFALSQSAGIALFTGNTALAQQKVTATKSRISSSITANGSQPRANAQFPLLDLRPCGVHPARSHREEGRRRPLGIQRPAGPEYQRGRELHHSRCDWRCKVALP